MNIHDFIKQYKYGYMFEKVKYSPPSGAGLWSYNKNKISIRDVDENGCLNNYVYLLIIKNEIVYVGYSGLISHRLRFHRSRLRTDDIYVCNFKNDYEKAINTESDIIQYINPILNNSYFIKYESMYSGNPNTLEYVLGYINCIKQLKNNSNKKTIKKFINSLKVG